MNKPVDATLLKNVAGQLERANMRVTANRVFILESLCAVEGKEMSVNDICHVLLEKEAGIGMGSIFRCLSVLERSGLLVRRKINAKKYAYRVRDSVLKSIIAPTTTSSETGCHLRQRPRDQVVGVTPQLQEPARVWGHSRDLQAYRPGSQHSEEVPAVR